MTISKGTLPAITPEYALPLDASLEFASAQTLTSTGYINNTNAMITIGPGRFSGLLALDITAAYVTSTDEYYQFFLMGSNDSGWTSGNIDLLAAWDIGSAASNRIVATILGASPTIPPAGRAGALKALPFTNMNYGGYVFDYLKLYLVTGGTTPSITLSAWIVPFEMKI